MDEISATVRPAQGNYAIVQHSDTELVKSACSGDIDSFRELYERYFAMAVGIARSRVFDQHLAEDAAQEAFAVACRQLHSLRDGELFAAWLATICQRTAIKMARSRINGMPLKQEPASPQSEDGCITTAQVHQALERLSATGREVIQLHYFSGLSHEEIARTLGISPQAVHGRLQRARRTLAHQLTKVG